MVILTNLQSVLFLHWAFMHLEDSEDKSKVFLGKTCYETFCKWYQVALTALSNLGFEPDDYGSHSFRKGIASFVAGFIGGPGRIISIFLRAGWSVGPVTL